MTIIRSSSRETVTTYARAFYWVSDPGAGFSFDCNAAGVVDRAKLSSAAIANLDACLSGAFDVADDGVVAHTHSYTVSALLRCRCGHTVELYSALVNTCDRCARDYNLSGQLLAHRSRWGEETGESLADILGPANYAQEVY